jgi:hypothetical protein
MPEHNQPHTPLQVIADAALGAFVEEAEESGVPIARAVFFALARNREACTAGFNFEDPDQMLEFLLDFGSQLGRKLGWSIQIIRPDEN